MNWKDYFIYDETSPSCLRWNVDVWTGRGYKRLVMPKGSEAGSLSGKGYWQVEIDSISYRVNRVVWELHNGLTTADGILVDHEDRNRQNNKIANLRPVSNAINCRNAKRQRNNSSGVTGVSYRKRVRYGHLKFEWIAAWRELNGKFKQKSFSCNLYGSDYAFQLACSYRQAQIDRLNLSGAGYTAQHGKDIL